MGPTIQKLYDTLTGIPVSYTHLVWTSPENAIAIVEQIADVLGELDPEQTAVYEENERCV